MARGAIGLLALLLCAVASPAPAQVEVSENPVRGDSVIIAWPPPSASASGNARISVFSYTGERLSEATVAAPSNEYVWDLTLGGARRVVNGAYIVVVEVAGHRYRRRLFVARRSP